MMSTHRCQQTDSVTFSCCLPCGRQTKWLQKNNREKRRKNTPPPPASEKVWEMFPCRSYSQAWESWTALCRCSSSWYSIGWGSSWVCLGFVFSSFSMAPAPERATLGSWRGARHWAKRTKATKVSEVYDRDSSPEWLDKCFYFTVS